MGCFPVQEDEDAVVLFFISFVSIAFAGREVSHISHLLLFLVFLYVHAGQVHDDADDRSSASNMSFATQKYLHQYGLLAPGGDDGRASAANQDNDGMLEVSA